jgi:hypothetical protein
MSLMNSTMFADDCVDYVTRTRNMRLDHEEKTIKLGNELNKFNGGASGIELFVSSFQDEQTKWFVVNKKIKEQFEPVFAARHSKDDVYAFKVLSEIESNRIGDGPKIITGIPPTTNSVIHHPKVGSLHDLFEELAEFISGL